MKMDFETQDGFLVMNDLPHDCIFNKVKTGCGATTIAIKNAENYVIAVPTTEIIENKCTLLNNRINGVRKAKRQD